MSRHFETVIIGGGQAGLATGHHLARRGRPFVILEANDRIGDNWRGHYDSLRLYRQRKQLRRPREPNLAVNQLVPGAARVDPSGLATV